MTILKSGKRKVELLLSEPEYQAARKMMIKYGLRALSDLFRQKTLYDFRSPG